MGRSRPSYDYPRVHPPHPQARYQSELKIEPSSNIDNRYSYMITPVEKRSGNSLPRTDTQSPPPPLPAVPDILHHGLQIPQSQAIPSQPPSRAQTPVEQMLHQYQGLTRQQEAIEYQKANTPQRSNTPVHQSQTPRMQTPQPTYQAQSSYATQPSTTSYGATTPVLQYQQYRPNTPQSTNVTVPQYCQQAPYQTQALYMSQLPEPVKVAPDRPNCREPVGLSQSNIPSAISTDEKSSPLKHTAPTSPKPPALSAYRFNEYAPAPQATAGGSWTHDLCSCSEPTICLTGLFCPCVLYGRIQHRLHLRSLNQDPTDTTSFNSVNGPCVAWTFACGINGILSGIQKTRVRRSYGMESGSGNIFSDCLKGCCCCCCTLAQSEKEIKSREEARRKAGTQTGYVPPVAMSFQPLSR